MTSKTMDNRNSGTTAANDILLTVLLAFSVILGLALYVPGAMAGVIGTGLNFFLKGMLGPVALVLPALIFVLSILLLVKRYPLPRLDMILHGFLVLVSLAALIHTVTVPLEDIYTLSGELALQAEPPVFEPRARDMIGLLWRSGAEPGQMGFLAGRQPGGILGGMMSLAFTSLFGKVGAMIILLAGLVIEAALLFNFSVSWIFSRTGTILRGAGSKLREAGYVAAEHVGAGTHTLTTNRAERRSQAETRQTHEGSWDHAVGGSSGNDGEDVERSRSLREPKSLAAAERESASGNQRRAYTIDSKMGSSDSPSLTIGRRDAKRLLSYGSAEPSASENDEEHSGEDALLVPDFFGEESKRSAKSGRNSRMFHDIAESSSADVTGSPQSQVPYSDSDEEWGDPREASIPNEQDRSRKPGQTAKQPVKVVTYEAKPSAKTADSKKSAQDKPAAKKEIGVRAEMADLPDAFAEEDSAELKKQYRLPPLDLLEPRGTAQGMSQDRAALLGDKLEQTLESFGVQARVVHITTGPTITRFELSPGPGVKVSRIVNLTDDIALSLAAVGVRIEAPIPGKSAIGIEISNKETAIVGLRGLLEEERSNPYRQRLMVALGRDIPGAPIYSDLSKMPHLLIAGATGSGKSICINVILLNILYRARPDEVKLLLVDPKVVELSIYNGIPHLLAPVVTDPKKAANTLNWAVAEMTRRYGLFAQYRVRDLASYNLRAAERSEEVLPQIVLVIDELSDLMVASAREVEEAIARLTAMARAAGIHLIIATQRPSVDVITGVIKANMPSRIAFAVTSQVDSRTILDQGGAEKLLGKGDMLYYPQSSSKPVRGQGAFVTEDEVETVVGFITAQGLGGYDEEVAEQIVSMTPSGRTTDEVEAEKSEEEEDELLPEAVAIILDAGYASVSILQRRLSVGYPRAARLVDTMEQLGYIGPFEGSKPRKVIITHMEWEQKKALEQGSPAGGEGAGDLPDEDDVTADPCEMSGGDETKERPEQNDSDMMEEDETPPFDFV